jgi:hypothetical protein
MLLLNTTACTENKSITNIESNTEGLNAIQPVPSVKQENNVESSEMISPEVVKDGNIEEFSDKDTSVLGIKLDMSISELESILGQPIKQDSHYEEAFGADVINYYYQFGEIRLEPLEEANYTVSSVVINKPNYSGPRGIKIGDSIEMVIQKFPCNEEAPKDESGERYVYGNLGENNGVITYNIEGNIEEVKYSYGYGGFGTYILRIGVENEKVISISVSVLNI